MADTSAAERYSYSDITDPNGICVASGYGVTIAVRDGHLQVHDGTGTNRRTRRYQRAGSGLRRLLIVGTTGTISLSALEWLHDSAVPWSHHNRTGELLAVSSVQQVNHVPMRRAQASALGTTEGGQIAADLLRAKIEGQAANVRAMGELFAATQIGRLVDELDSVDPDSLLPVEATAARIYFETWIEQVAMRFVAAERDTIPKRWSRFEGRHSAIGIGTRGKARNATDPLNAVLNFLFSVLEAEAVLACHRVGIDPGLGVLHRDQIGRNSLALDIMEPVRPIVERWTLDLLSGHVFSKRDFVEHVSGTVRIRPPLLHHLAATAPLWTPHVGHWAEHVAHAYADVSERPIRKTTPVTRRRTFAANRKGVLPPVVAPRKQRPNPAPSRRCKRCGEEAVRRQVFCAACWSAVKDDRSLQTESRSDAMRRVRAQQRRNEAAEHGWTLDDWESTIFPAVRTAPTSILVCVVDLSSRSVQNIKAGAQIPSPRHWRAMYEAATGVR